MITKPMLSGKVDDTRHLSFPVAATPKLDGIRCLKVDGNVVSRTFKPIKNHFIRETLEKVLPDNADGEIMAGTTFQECTSAVMTMAGEPDFNFYMFDYVPGDLKMPYMERMARMEEWFNENKPNNVVLWLPKIVETVAELNEYESECLEEGFEGVMVRSLRGPYKCGRGTLREGYLLKIKQFQDAEAEIIGYEPLYHNANEAKKDAFGRTERSSHKENKIPMELLGKFVLRDIESGVEFGCGVGLTHEQRKQFWLERVSLVGRIVKYSSFKIGVKDAPRHPKFLGFRDPSDM